MRLPIFLAASLIGSVLSSPLLASSSHASTPPSHQLATRENKPLTESLARILTSVNRVDARMKARPNGGTLEEASYITDQLIAATKELSDDVRISTRDVRQMPNVVVADMIPMLAQLTSIGMSFSSVCDGWAAAKTMVSAAGKVSLVVNVLMDTNDSVQSYADALNLKLPYGTHNAGNAVKKAFTDFIDNTIALYKKK